MSEQPVKMGRPKKGSDYIPVRMRKQPKPEKPPKVAKKMGRPKTRESYPVGASFSLGRNYIDLLDEMAENLQITKSAIVRDCINRLAVRFGFPQATFEFNELPFRPTAASEGNDAFFTLGDNHKALLARMRKVRDDANDGKPAGRRLPKGTTQLLREEIDRLAVEHGYEPLNPLTDKVIAE